MNEHKELKNFLSRIEKLSDGYRSKAAAKRHENDYRTARENLDHLVDGIKLGNASAVLAASIFHYGKHSVKEAKEYLDLKGIPVRI